ncbi:HNH endonuclease [Microbacterium sp. Yaish 1]|uniref:HNH endonuclease n=1 Tax=Microbacterium sp. Yaish 1 TaxID=2025014 RepID=UPI00117E2A23|nr:HNH endonuclease [Microbacterium sp. Yaish 1]
MTTEGMSIPKWGGRRAVEALNRVKAEGRRHRSPCCICGQRINYDLPSTDANGCTVQHKKSRKLFPALTWDPSNWAPAHKSCNESEGSGESGEDAGVSSFGLS